MPIHLKLLFVIADGGHARFVRPAEEDNTLHSSDRVHPEDGHKTAAVQHDAGIHHAQAPRHDPHGDQKEAFGAWVAAQLNEGAAAKAYDEIVLVAPAHTLSAIRKKLNHEAATKVIGSLEKDLTKMSDHDLWPHIHEWVRPVHRAALMRG
jgi:protein required for attachment to host cells